MGSVSVLAELRGGLARLGVIHDDAELWEAIGARWPAGFWLDLNNPDSSLFAKHQVGVAWALAVTP